MERGGGGRGGDGCWEREWGGGRGGPGEGAFQARERRGGGRGPISSSVPRKPLMRTPSIRCKLRLCLILTVSDLRFCPSKILYAMHILVADYGWGEGEGATGSAAVHFRDARFDAKRVLGSLGTCCRRRAFVPGWANSIFKCARSSS